MQCSYMYMYTAELSNCYMTVCLGFHKVFLRLAGMLVTLNQKRKTEGFW